jgi:hypothetical protein
MTDIVAGLVKRRAELSGEAETLRARLAAIGADLEHLDAVIRQFDPEHDIASIRPKRPRNPDAAGRGEMSRALLSVLREASEPLSTVEVAERLGKAHGVDSADKRAIRLLTKRVGMTLSHQRAKGTVRSLSSVGTMGLWEVDR